MPRARPAALGRASRRRRRRSCRRREGKETVVFETTDVLSLLRAARVARELKLQARFVGGRGRVPAACRRWRRRSPTSSCASRFRSRTSWIGTRSGSTCSTTPPARVRPRAGQSAVASGRRSHLFAHDGRPRESRRTSTTRVREAMARGLSRGRRARGGDRRFRRGSSASATAWGLWSPDKIANLVVRDGAPFEEKSAVAEIWIDGNRIDLAPKKTDAASAAAKSPRAGRRRRTCGPAPAREGGPLALSGAVVVRGADRVDAGPLGHPRRRRRARRRREDRGGRSRPRGAGRRSGDRRPGQARHAGHHRRALAHRASTTRPTRARTTSRPRFGSATCSRPSTSRSTASSPAARRPSNVLHGSANSIGGQNQIVKWRWGGGPGRPRLRRRARGHQVRARREPEAVELEQPRRRATRRRAWASPSRSASASRRRRTTAAGRTSTARRASGKGARPIPPAPDLQLEAIAEILEGKRTIHCHSYRKDEILQMIRSAEEFGVKIGTFQHVLEGYKVADEIARHGAGASGFSDWWAYKVEVFDAIPYAFPLMRERGVLVSFNSDSTRPRAAPEPRGRQGREIRQRGARRRAGVRDVEPGEAARHRRRGSARSRPARTATSWSGAGIRSRPRRSRSRPGSRARSTSTARPTSPRGRLANPSAPR